MPAVVVLFATFVVLVMASAAANAAVRRCQPAVSSGAQEAATELEARKLALGNWLIAAGRYSPAHANWRLAAKKSITCSPIDSGGFRCLAIGAPCVIEQVPGPPPKRKLDATPIRLGYPPATPLPLGR